jgi:hypothetical protein
MISLEMIGPRQNDVVSTCEAGAGQLQNAIACRKFQAASTNYNFSGQTIF